MTMLTWQGWRRFRHLTDGTAVAALTAASLLVGAGAARAEEGCPAGQLPSQIDDRKCSKLSEYSQLPMDDAKPMVFEAVQDSPMLVYLQATGTITSDTPAQFEKFLKSDEAKTAIASTATIQLHSPGGDITAGVRLGDLIRKARLNTQIGRSAPLEGPSNNYSYTRASCMSACALAFLGGVGREYRPQDTYGFASAASASNDLSVTSDYLKRMGLDPAALRDIGHAGRIPVALAQRMLIIFTPPADSTFHAGGVKGNPVARFDFSLRTKTYRGMVGCRDHETVLYVVDREAAIPAALYALKDTPAEFHDGAKTTLAATATYVKGKTARDGVMQFKIKGLTATSFSADGLRLMTIDKPTDVAWPATANAQPDLITEIDWADRVTEFSFVIRSGNAETVLPAVLKGCSGA